MPCLAAVPAAGAAAFLVPAELRLVNYYPARNGWTYMWERWDPAQIDRDFALIAGLHANAVRVIVQPASFGFPQPRPDVQARLDHVVRLAASHGLAVQLTLFDWWSDYRRIERSKRWARLLLQPYAGDPRIAAVELRNEIDPLDPGAVAWARVLLPYLHAVLPGVPTTISVGANDGVRQMWTLKEALGPAAQPDFWSFHYYDKPELAAAAFAAARAAVAPTPVFVGETGYHPGNSDPPVRTRADREDEQVRYFKTIAAATSRLGLPPVAPWILLDFTRRGTPVRMNPAEYTFGLFRADGSAKPAAAAVRAAFTSPEPDALFNGGFEEGTACWRQRGAAVFDHDLAVFHGGGTSMTLTGVGGRATNRATLSTIPPVPWVTEGEPLTLSVWARGENATGTTVASIRFYDGQRRQIAEVETGALPPGTTDWTQLELRTVVPPAASYVRILLGSDANRGRVWFDDVALERG